MDSKSINPDSVKPVIETRCTGYGRSPDTALPTKWSFNVCAKKNHRKIRAIIPKR